MQIKEAIVLAGGLGTRLRDAVPDLPKCMAPVNGIPFIAYVIKYLSDQGIERFIFSLGYRSEAFTQFLTEALPQNNYTVIIEEEPLGTGGAIRLACNAANDLNVLVVNGDSIFKNDLSAQANLHFSKKADCTLALKPMEHFDRYGAVELNTDQRIALFKEKQLVEKGLINGGVYMINVASFLQEQLPEKFSFETGYLQQFFTTRNIVGISQEGYFIDIGIPEDYLRAQTELK
jgi:D-glycero-alpha-D-manno-heptose 1-phosphate guanylyltransferase